MRSRIRTVDVALCLLVAYALLLSKDFRNVGAQGDTQAYFASARSLAVDGRLLLPDGSPNTVWPPGYPLALALHYWLGLPIAAYARLWQVALYGALLWLLRRALDETGPDGHRLDRTAVFVALAVFPPTLYLTSAGLSELQYAVLAGASMAALIQAVRSPRQTEWRLMMVATAACAAAWLTRLQATSLVVCGVLLVLADTRVPFERRLGRAIAWAGPPVVAIGLWMLRNYAVSDRLQGGEPSANGYLTNLSSMFLSYVSAVAPVFGQDAVNRALGLVRAAAVVVIGLPMVATASVLLRRRVQQPDATSAVQAACLIYFLVEVALLPLLASLVRVDTLHYRFVQASGAAFLLACGIELLRRPLPRLVSSALLGVAAGWAAWALVYVHAYSRAWNHVPGRW